MWRRLSERSRFGENSSNNNYEYDALATENEEDNSLTENFRLLPLTNGYSRLNGHQSRTTGANRQNGKLNGIFGGGDHPHVVNTRNHLNTSSSRYQEDIEDPQDSDAEEFNKFSYHYDTNNRNRKMLRNRDRYAPSSVENPNYSAGVIDIGPVDGFDNNFGDLGGGGAGGRDPSPNHPHMLSPDDYRQNPNNPIVSVCCNILRYMCW